MLNPHTKAKLTWHCRRGMLELDLILQRFLTHHVDNLTELQLKQFERLLMEQDPDLYAWLMGYEQPLDKELHEIVTVIQSCDNSG